MDKFKVKILSQTQNPQTVIYAAMHQDYSGDYIGDQNFPSEERCGEIIVSRLLKGNRGHYGPLEHPSITLSCGYFPHSVMQQARTHRVGVSFDVQSFRYSSSQLFAVNEGAKHIEDVIYVRPVGSYFDRKGNKYFYTNLQREKDLFLAKDLILHYCRAVSGGMSEEHARGLLPFDYRQHFVVSFNVRSLMHFLDLRHKKDAQLEIQKLCELLWTPFSLWCPQIASWYESSRKGKALLSP